jgi:nucleoside-diphosphate-sugar epimerase
LKRFILASTGSVYGYRTELAREDDPVAPYDPYSVSKVAAEQVVRLFRTHFATIILRLFFPYGPGQQERLIPTLVNRICRGEPVTLVNGGQPACQPMYIDDVIEVFQACLGLDESRVINVAGPETTDILGLAGMMGRLVGRAPVFNELSDPTKGSQLADTSRMRNILGVTPSVGVARGLERTVAWLTANDPALAIVPGTEA